MLFHSPTKEIPRITIRMNNIELEPTSDFNFVGIIINKHLKWNAHIDKISNNIARTNGIINRLKYYLPCNVLLNIYNCLILPHLYYGILAWGYETSRIFKLQQISLRAMCSAKYNTHTEPLFKRLNLLKICDIHKIQQLKMFYKLVRKDLPEYFNTIPVTKLSDIHDHVTRNRNTYYTNRVAHKFADKCFRQSIFHTVNHVPELIREKIFTHSLKGFSNYSKTLFVSNYLYECMIPHCYVCNC